MLKLLENNVRYHPPKNRALLSSFITPTFRPCTHTSDDSYIYQLSLVLATATVSLYPATHNYSIPGTFYRTDFLIHTVLLVRFFVYRLCQQHCCVQVACMYSLCQQHCVVLSLFAFCYDTYIPGQQRPRAPTNPAGAAPSQ